MKVGVNKGSLGYSVGVVIRVSGSKSLVKFDAGYTRWCNTSNLEEIV